MYAGGGGRVTMSNHVSSLVRVIHCIDTETCGILTS